MALRLTLGGGGAYFLVQLVETVECGRSIERQYPQDHLSGDGARDLSNMMINCTMFQRVFSGVSWNFTGVFKGVHCWTMDFK